MNQARFLEATIRSVLLQRYPALEYIVVDGGSTDGSIEIVKRYEPWLTAWVSEPDRGQAQAINKGFRRARGQIVAWLNADDYYRPSAVAEAAAVLAHRPRAAMVYGQGHAIDARGRPLWPEPGAAFHRRRALFHDPVPQPTAFIRRDALKAAGYLDESLHLELDLDLWLRLTAQGLLVRRRRAWACLRTHKDTKTTGGQHLRWEEHCRIGERLLEDPRWQRDRTAVLRSIGYAHWFASMAWWALGDHPRALAHVDRAIARLPNGPATAFFVGQIPILLLSAGQPFEAAHINAAQFAAIEAYFGILPDALPAKTRAYRMAESMFRGVLAVQAGRSPGQRCRDLARACTVSPGLFVTLGVGRWRTTLRMARRQWSRFPAVSNTDSG